MPEEIALGGHLQQAVRIGDTVHRRGGAWTPAVHSLLRYLEAARFPAPRVIGMDAQGREVLRFIEGEAYAEGDELLAHGVMEQSHLVEAAQLLRRYHDIVAQYRPPANATWRLIAPTPYEMICHNDWSPWNALLRAGKVEVMLDWDLAGPGTRLWDVANAAYCWVPLIASMPVPRASTDDLDLRVRRLALFCDAYGLEDRSELLVTLRRRLAFVGRFIEREAAGGDIGMQHLVGMAVPSAMFDSDVRWLDANRATLERAL